MENNIKYDIFNTKDNSSNATIFLDQQLLENDRFSKKKQLERDSNINSTLIETYDKEKENKNYIYIPYENKEEAKLNGAIWDMNFKLWYVSDINNLLYEKYKKRFFGGAQKYFATFPMVSQGLM